MWSRAGEKYQITSAFGNHPLGNAPTLPAKAACDDESPVGIKVPKFLLIDNGLNIYVRKIKLHAKGLDL